MKRWGQIKGDVDYKTVAEQVYLATDRLARLEAHALVARQRQADDARRISYRLTAKGIDLAPVIVEMIVWAARYERTAAPPEEVAKMESDRDAYIAAIRARWLESAPRSSRIPPAPSRARKRR